MPNPPDIVNPDPDKLRAARAWAKAYNTFDIGGLEALLDEDFCYTSMWVWEDLVGHDTYLEYLRGKLATIRKSDAPVCAEIAETPCWTEPLSRQICSGLVVLLSSMPMSPA